MNVLAEPRCQRVDFELTPIAVLAINGCGRFDGVAQETPRKHHADAQSVPSAACSSAVLHAVTAATLALAAVGQDRVGGEVDPRSRGVLSWLHAAH